MIRMIILSLFFSVTAFGEIYITVTGANVKRAKLALGELHPLPGVKSRNTALEKRVYQQLKDDLDLINLFDPINPKLFTDLDTARNFYTTKYSDWSVLQASFLLKLGYRMEKNQFVLEALFYDIPGEKKIFGTRYTYPPSQYARLVHALSEDILKAVTGEKGLFFSRVVMSCRNLRQRKSPPKEIYVVDPDGRNFTPLTRDKTLSLSPTWHPNGKQIAYMQYEFRGRGKNRKKATVLKVHDLRTGKRKVISDRPGMNSGAAFSQDGSRLAFTMSFTGRPEIYIVDPNNPSNPEPLSRSIQWRRLSGSGFHKNNVSTLFDVEPSWSPDGKQVVISSARTGHPMIYIVDLASKEARQLTFAGTYNSSPSWSPTGDKILFAAQRTDFGNFDIYQIDADGNNLSRLTSGTRPGKRRGVNSENPSWAPTGRHLAFSSNEGGTYAVYVMSGDGRIKRQISPKGYECHTPNWSPSER